MKTDDTLNNLLEYLYDAHYGYLECAKEVTDSYLKDLFKDLAQKRLSMINDIKKNMSLSIDDITNKGSITGALHRSYIDLKSLLTSGDMLAIVDEIKRGEYFTIKKYENVIENNLPDNLKTLLLNQLNEIENDLNTINSIAQMES